MAAARSKQAQDILGMPVATDGHLPEAYINNLQSFAADLVASGYVRYYVNIAPMGTSNPRTSASECKGGRGNCFNPDLMALDWSVAQQVISSLRAALGHKIDLVFDLASEQCLFDPNVELFRNYDSFVRYMLSRYKETFGSGGFVISCGAGNGLAPKAVAGLRSLGERYRELRIKPAAIDVHVYPTNLPAIMSLLRTANEVADQLRVPVDIAETYANNELILSSVSDMVQSRQLNLRTIMMYPTTAENQCNIPAPYDISSFDVMLGRRNAAGAKKQVCN
jgi:hypothetical protein